MICRRCRNPLLAQLESRLKTWHRLKMSETQLIGFDMRDGMPIMGPSADEQHEISVQVGQIIKLVSDAVRKGRKPSELENHFRKRGLLLYLMAMTIEGDANHYLQVKGVQKKYWMTCNIGARAYHLQQLKLHGLTETENLQRLDDSGIIHLAPESLAKKVIDSLSWYVLPPPAPASKISKWLVLFALFFCVLFVFRR